MFSALTALVASIVSPFVTISTAKRQIKASVISANRTRWLEGLREQLATLISEFAAAKPRFVGVQFLSLRSRIESNAANHQARLINLHTEFNRPDCDLVGCSGNFGVRKLGAKSVGGWADPQFVMLLHFKVARRLRQVVLGGSNSKVPTQEMDPI